MINKQKFFIIVIFFLSFLSGCSSRRPAPLGFLNEYRFMKESPLIKGLFFFKDPGIDLAKYNKIIIEPVIISGKDIELNKYEKQHLSDFFQDELKIAFCRTYAVSDNFSGNGVLRVYSSIEVLASKPILNLHWSTTLPGFGIGGAAMEIEFVDSQKENSVLSFMAAQKGNRFKKIDGLTKWKHTERILKKWANEIKSVFDGFYEK